MLSLIFAIVGLVCFALAALGASVPRVNLGWAGLFFVWLSTLV
jgi:hypothetical protein